MKVYNEGIGWKMGMAMEDSEGDPLHNDMHSVGTDLAKRQITVSDTRNTEMWNTEIMYVCMSAGRQV